MSNYPKISVEKSFIVGPTDPTHKIPGPSVNLPGIGAINGPLIVGGQSDGYVFTQYQNSMLSILPPSNEVSNNPLSLSGKFFGPLADAIIISKQGDPAPGPSNRYDGVGIRVNANAHKIEGGELIAINCDRIVEINARTTLTTTGPSFTVRNRVLTVNSRSTFNKESTFNKNVVMNKRLQLAKCGDVARRINRADTLPSSDKRLKENIKKIENPIDKVCSIRGVEFDFIFEKDYGYLNKHQIGVVAQEIEKVIPEVVSENSDGYKTVSYQHLTALLIEAIKEQQKEIDNLKKIVLKEQNGN